MLRHALFHPNRPLALPSGCDDNQREEKMKNRIALGVFAFASMAAWAGPMDQPWSVVESGDASEVRKEAPAAITRVDGKSTRDPRTSDMVTPGKHVITVRFDSGRAVVTDNSRELAMDLEACKRYRVVAAYKSKTSGDWEPKVYPEVIGECAKRFKK
jgi:hypothetical protein